MKVVLFADRESVETVWEIGHVRSLIDSYYKNKPETLISLCKTMKNKPNEKSLSYGPWNLFCKIRRQKITGFKVFTDRLEIRTEKEDKFVEDKPYMSVRMVSYPSRPKLQYEIMYFIPYQTLEELGLEAIDECRVYAPGDSISLSNMPQCGISIKAEKRKGGILFRTTRAKWRLKEEVCRNPFRWVGASWRSYELDIDQDGDSYNFRMGRAKRSSK